jgi:hypothetical protein
MVGVDMGVDHEPDSHAGLVGDAQIWFDLSHRVHYGAGGMTAAAEQVRDRNRVGMEEMTQGSCWPSCSSEVRCLTSGIHSIILVNDTQKMRDVKPGS